MDFHFKRKLLKPSDIFVIFLTLLLIFAVYLGTGSSNSEKAFAVITVKNTTIEIIDLSKSENRIITLKTEPTVTLEIRDCKIRFIDSECPDGTCEKTGWLSKPGDTAVCLPAKTAVSIKGSAPKETKSDIDAVVG